MGCSGLGWLSKAEIPWITIISTHCITFAQALGLLEEMRSAGVEPDVVS